MLQENTDKNIEHKLNEERDRQSTPSGEKMYEGDDKSLRLWKG